MTYFLAVFPCNVYYWILFRPIAANGCHQKISSLYSFPVFFGQVYFVLVLTSTNHNARNWYPEMLMARTVYRNLINFKFLEQVSSCCIVKIALPSLCWVWRRVLVLAQQSQPSTASLHKSDPQGPVYCACLYLECRNLLNATGVWLVSIVYVWLYDAGVHFAR